MKTLQIENTRELFFTSKEQYLHFRKVWSQTVNSAEKNKLTGGHHLIYSLLRGRDAVKGFTPTTSTNKLSNGAYINYGLYEARSKLSRMANNIQQGIDVSIFLSPFNETVTPLMIIKLNELCPSVDLLESNFGKGNQIAKLIIESNSKPISYADMWTMYEEAA